MTETRKMESNKNRAYEQECAKLAALWNQHEICPECGNNNILVIEDYTRCFFSKPKLVRKYKCLDCGCLWL